MPIFLPLLAKIGLWFLNKYIKNEAKREELNKQWLDTIHNISSGVADSSDLGVKDAEARARLDARFNELRGKI
jgi:hypothetical protein